MAVSMSRSCSLVIMACLVADMQHTAEQYVCPIWLSREPTHWIQAIRRGIVPSDRRRIWPWKGPAAERIRSYSRLVITSYNFV